jgi:hypothetical protein
MKSFITNFSIKTPRKLLFSVPQENLQRVLRIVWEFGFIVLLSILEKYKLPNYP